MIPRQWTEGSEEPAGSDPALPFWRLPVNRLQWLPAGLGCVFYLQGRGSPLALLLLSFGLPAVRFFLALHCRQQVRRRLRRLWDTLESYPLCRERLPWPGVLVTVVLPFGLLLLLRDYAIVSGDSRPAVLTASALVTEGHADIGQLVGRYSQLGMFAMDGGMPYFCRQTNAGVVSSYPLGMVPFVLPVAAAARVFGADLDLPHVHDRLEKWTAAWIAAFSLGLFFLLALHVAEVQPAWMATWILGTGSVFFTTIGQALWQHDGVILWSLIALLIEFRAPERSGWMGTLLQGFAIGMMLPCRLSAVVFIVPFALWVFLRTPVRALGVALFSGLTFVPWACLHVSIYGSVFGPSTGQLAAGNWSPVSVSSLAGILISPGRGIFVYQPWILLAVLHRLPVLRRKAAFRACRECPAGWTTFCLCAVVFQLALISSWKCWWGGYCWGSRLTAETIPLLALLCVRPIAMLWRTGVGQRVVLAFAMLSLLMHVPAVYLRSAEWHGRRQIDHHPERLWVWSDAPFLYPLWNYTLMPDSAAHRPDAAAKDTAVFR
ncbi:MAG TPA: hypothetical protein VKU02_11045 [Gemmataceae bacterium]|nr:hypothetical protein [Gemmataceae bacterium]